MNKKYKLQILMPSYNKERYIEKALDSIFNQKNNFAFQVIVTDDCSTDNTINIVKIYQKKYPNRIVLLPSPKNERLLANIIKAYEYMDCEYFCCLDADDYLTDNYFYQDAIDFLEANKNYYIYAANTNVLGKDNVIFSQNKEIKCNYVDSSFSDMLCNRAVLGNTISSVFRNTVIDLNLINELKSHIGDSYEEHSYREDDFRNRIHLEKGNVHFVNKVVGVYRSTDDGLYQGSNQLKKINLKITSYIDSTIFSKNNIQSLLIWHIWN